PSGYGEGRVYLGSTTVTTDPKTCLADFSVTFPVATAGQVITATATDDNGNTSEFAQALATTATTIPTTTTLTAAPNPSKAGQPITFTATVTSANGQPSGNLRLKEGDLLIGDLDLTNGQAVFTVSDLFLGQHSIQAVYDG